MQCSIVDLCSPILAPMHIVQGNYQCWLQTGREGKSDYVSGGLHLHPEELLFKMGGLKCLIFPVIVSNVVFLHHLNFHAKTLFRESKGVGLYLLKLKYDLKTPRVLQ